MPSGELLPLLAERYNPQIKDVLCRVASQAAEWHQESAAAATALLATCERPRAGVRVILDRETLNRAPRPLLRALWRQVWRREGWPRQAMGYREWNRLARFCQGRAETAIELPGRVRVSARDHVVQADPGARAESGTERPTSRDSE
jgi:hypothetical protein